MSKVTSRILLVDDEEPNRALIHAYLAESSFTIVDAASGVEALEMMDHFAPDLVLLDVLMPGMDGFEVARRIKALQRNLFLPVVLVTALTDQSSRRRGLLAGADDFLSKPVDPQELTVRVRNLLALRDKERALLEKNEELAKLHRFKEEVSTLLVHDLRSPLAASLACLEHSLATCQCQGDTREALEDAYGANRRLQAMVADVLEVDRLEATQVIPSLSRFDMHPWFASMLGPRRWEASQRNISLENRLDPGSIAYGDLALLTRVFENLIDNALRYTPAGGRIVVDAFVESGGTLQLRIGNTGTPIRPALRKAVFEKYGRGDQRLAKTNYGFGLYFCRLAIAAHGGRISVEETPDLPTVFLVELPAHATLKPEIVVAGFEPPSANHKRYDSARETLTIERTHTRKMSSASKPPRVGTGASRPSPPIATTPPPTQ